MFRPQAPACREIQTKYIEFENGWLRRLQRRFARVGSVDQTDAVATAALGVVERSIPLLYQGAQAGRTLVEQGAANAQGHRIRRGECLGSRFVKTLTQDAAHLNDSLARRIAQQDHEFIAAKPGCHRAIGQDRTNHLAEHDQQPVARRVPIKVIDRLEVVDIDQTTRAPLAAATLPPTRRKSGTSPATAAPR